MKHLYLISFASFILLAACKKDKISGSGATIYETRPVSNFTSVQVSGPTIMIIEKGPQYVVKVNAFENLLPHFETIVNSGVLDVHWKNDVKVEGNNLVVYVTLPALFNIKVSGHTAVSVAGEFSSTNMAVTVDGSGSVYLHHQQADNFFVTVSGVGMFAGMGMVSQVEAFGLTCKKAVVNLTGNGKVELTCLSALDVKIAGRGNVFYKGNPTVTSDISGGGAIYKR